MKRSWMGAGLLLAMLLTGILTTRCMIRFHAPIARDLDAAAEAALTGNWTRACDLSRRAQKSWEETERFRMCFADHDPVEEIDGCFARLEIYSRREETIAFAAVSVETARKVEAVGEAHKMIWDNFF